ncbi:MAG: hypothetical protein ACRDZX_01225, partial [Acidimicrobiales bacterium]
TGPRPGFFAIGPGAALWLTEAAPAGPAQGQDGRRRRPGQAGGAEAVDDALAQAAVAGRFSGDDVASVLATGAQRPGERRSKRARPTASSGAPPHGEASANEHPESRAF